MYCDDIIDFGHCRPIPMYRDHTVPLSIFSYSDTNYLTDYNKEQHPPTAASVYEPTRNRNIDSTNILSI